MTRLERDVLVCRDCCCGTVKHPDVDHDAQVEWLREVAAESAGRVRVRVVECLDECDRSNVVVVRDLTRRRRERDTWLGGVLDEAATATVAAWVAEGGPLPRELRRHVVDRPAAPTDRAGRAGR